MKRAMAALAMILAGTPAIPQNYGTKTDTAPVQGSGSGQQLQDLTARVTALEHQLKDLQGEVSYYRYLLDQKQTTHDTIQINSNSRTFQRIDTDNSTFLVALDTITPYMKGYKLNVSIGNPSNATFSGARIKVRWGKAYNWANFTEASYKQWQSTIQQKETELKQDLVPGAWNPVELMLVPSTKDELGFLELSMTTRSMTLHAKP